MLALILIGCAARRGAADVEVRRIAFDGNRGTLNDRSNGDLRQVMTHPKPRFRPWPVRRRVALDRIRLDADRSRVLTYLAHRGYFDAELDWRVRTRRPAGDDRPQIVDIVGEVTLGPVTHIADVRINGLDALPRGVRRRTRRARSGQGDVFRLDIHESNLAAFRRALQTQGYPDPGVEGAVRVRRADRTATLDYAIAPGEPAVLRDVVIEGLERVPRAAVERRVRLTPGDPFDISALERTRVRLYGMDVFSIVSVTPRLADEPGLVDVLVSVEERAPRGVAVRSGVELQSGRQQVLIGGELSHLNALRRLWRVELDAEVGAAVVGSQLGQLGSIAELRTGPVADVTLDLTVPDVPRPTWNTALQIGFEHTITEAFQTNRPSARAVLAVTPTPTLTLSGAYRFDFVDYVDLQIDPADLARFGAAPDVVDGRYRNAEIQTQVVWDTRDDPLSPTRGQVFDVTGELAATWLGGSYRYGGAKVDLRAYRGLGRRARGLRRALGLRPNALVFAARLGGGILEPYGPAGQAVVPIAERLYLGGTGSVRGWGFQRLGPYVCDAEERPCTYRIGQSIDEDRDTVPIGGQVASWGSLEVRQTFGSVRVVGFADAGMVWSTPDEIPLRRPQVSVGGGLRLLTPVGPVRLDVAVRTDDPPEFSTEDRVWIHLGLGEAF